MTQVARLHMHTLPAVIRKQGALGIVIFIPAIQACQSWELPICSA